VSSVNVDSAGQPRTNWAGNITYGAADFYRPASISQLQGVVARAAQIKVLATGHSFNDMADSPGAQVSLADLIPDVEVDSTAGLARVAAGLSYAQLASRLDDKGFALRNMASLPHISVAGACATATHGSGLANQNLAASIAALEFVTADGDLVELSRGDDSFPGAVVHLGALGVVTRLVLETVPSFEVSQWVYEGLPLEVLDDHFTEIMSSSSTTTPTRTPPPSRSPPRPRRSPKPRGSPPRPLPASVTRCPARRPPRALPSSESPAGGTSGCRISAPTSPPARVTSCSPSSCSPSSTRRPPSTR
jgi:xylitol oxidase